MALSFLALMLGLLSAAAAPPTQAEIEAQLEATWNAAAKVATRGPAEVKLLDQASLELTDGEFFVPQAEANQIMLLLGNGTNAGRQGVIVTNRPGAQWMIVVSWVAEGYVRDGDAKEWQADELLESLREGTESQNTERLARGTPALDVVGWVEPPVYDGAAHRLVWSLSLRERGEPSDRPRTINYNTYALGRDGFFSLNLITSAQAVAADKDVVRRLLGTLAYVPGKRYEDFDQSTDKVAAYGLAALIGAVAVKKLGLLALAGAFLLKIWKLGAIALIAVAAAARRFFRRSPPPSANT
jgi:uncharacterized membrane-anchored protein